MNNKMDDKLMYIVQCYTHQIMTTKLPILSIKIIGKKVFIIQS